MVDVSWPAKAKRQSAARGAAAAAASLKLSYLSLVVSECRKATGNGTWQWAFSCEHLHGNYAQSHIDGTNTEMLGMRIPGTAGLTVAGALHDTAQRCQPQEQI